MNTNLKSDQSRRRRSKRVMIKLEYSPPPPPKKDNNKCYEDQSNINTECRDRSRSLSPDINVIRRQLKALADWV